MFETTFTHSSSSPLPGNIPLDGAIDILHDFDTVIRFSPDCRNAKPIEPPNGKGKPNGTKATPSGEQWWEVEDDLPFMPKKLWSGGVKYNAIFVPVRDGCDITIMAPGGFTSVNHWRLVHQSEGEHHTQTTTYAQPTARPGMMRRDTKAKDLDHADTTGGGWYVQIVSDAKCSRTFVNIIKGFLKNSHVQLQRAFINRLQHDQEMRMLEEKMDKVDILQSEKPKGRPRRPTIGRRQSSEF